MALHALRRNIMRSALTTLGIVIGVAAVIAMTEIGQGTSAAVQKTIQSMGANNLMVLPGAAANGGVSYGSGSVMTLTPQDADAILKECPAVNGVAPVVRVGRTQIVFGNRNYVPNTIQGTSPAYLDVREWSDLAEGEPITDADVRNGARICMVGQTIVDNVFDGGSPIGREIRLQNVGFKVVGVLSSRGANMMGMDQDDIVIAPWTTIKARLSGSSTALSASSAGAGSAVQSASQVNTLSQSYPGNQTSIYPTPSPMQQIDNPTQTRFANIDQIIVRANSTEEMPIAIKQITALLHDRHHIKAGQLDDFNIRDMTEVTKALGSTTETMTRSLLFVALVSLLVGGVGIMNIMLVSVTERTREIGLRMAVGARATDILRQFLVEAVVLCLLGGLMGILLGCGTAWIMNWYLRWPIELSLPAIFGAVIVSAAVGIIFGYYPAWKASRLDPIEALRYE